MSSSNVLSMYRNLLKLASRLKPIDKRNNAIIQIKNDFRNHIHEEDKDKVRIMLEKASSTLGYLKIVTPRNLSTYEQKDSVKLIFGDNNQKQNKAAVSNWTGSNLDPDSVKRHQHTLKRAGFKNNQDVKDLFSPNWSTFPQELSGIVLPNQWDYIVYSINEATKEGHGWACIAEAICCIVFLFPCIFLCHPCFAEPLRYMRIDDRLKQVNSTCFHSQRAVYRQGVHVYIDTDQINMTLQTAQAQNIIYSTGSNTSGGSTTHYVPPTQVIIIDHTRNPVSSQNNSQTGEQVPVVTATVVN